MEFLNKLSNMNNQGNYEVKKINENEMPSFVDVWTKAYPGEVPDDFDEEKQKKLVERWNFVQNEIPTLNFYGCFRNDKLLGGMLLYDYTMNVFNTKTEVGGVALVCVDLLHKKEHVGKEIMKFSHNHFYNRDFPLTALYPALTAVLAFIFLKESVTPTKIAGIIFSLVAIYLLSK